MQQQNAQQKQCLNETKVKELIMDTLIELNLVQQPQRKKVLTDV